MRNFKESKEKKRGWREKVSAKTARNGERMKGRENREDGHEEEKEVGEVTLRGGKGGGRRPGAHVTGVVLGVSSCDWLKSTGWHGFFGVLMLVKRKGLPASFILEDFERT